MKQCSKCKEWKELTMFGVDKKRPDGLYSTCKVCKKQYRIDTKDKIRLRKKNYYLDNKDKILLHQKKRFENNKEVIHTQAKKSRKTKASYEFYKDKLTIDESCRCAKDKISLEVKCKYCGKYFSPTKGQVRNRLQAILGQVSNGSENNLYCSEKCKYICPIFNQYKYPKGHVSDSAWQSREVQAELRQMVFEIDEWECQRCGATTQDAELHCHHLTGVELNPIESADVDNCITLCEFHHNELHKRKGCTYNDFKRKACKTKED